MNGRVKALPWIAMGFAVILLAARAGGWDLLPDPLGWVLVLLGTRALPEDVELQPVLRTLAFLALVVSAVTWVPAVVDRIDDESLRWAASLPQLAYVGLLAHVLSLAAAADRPASRWWSGVRTVVVVVTVLPVLVFGGGVTSLRDVAGVLTVAAPLLVIVLLVAHRDRPWAVGRAPVATPSA